MQGIYILHFDEPTRIPKRYGGPNHYVGLTTDIYRRLKRHRAGYGGYTTHLAYEDGIKFTPHPFKMDPSHANELEVTKRVDLYCPDCVGTLGTDLYKPKWVANLIKRWDQYEAKSSIS